MNTHVVGKFYQASSTIAAHAAFPAIGIVIFHFKIITFFAIEQHQAICPNTEASVADISHLLYRKLNIIGPVVDDHKIISCSWYL